MLTYRATRSLADHVPFFRGLNDEFNGQHYDALLEWCEVLPTIEPQMFRDRRIIELDGQPVGICGLYSFSAEVDELWLGWFGMLKEHRSKGYGGQALTFMKSWAKSLGCKELCCHVFSAGKPLPFYYREGFKRVCSTPEFLTERPHLSEWFDEPGGHILKYDLTAE